MDEVGKLQGFWRQLRDMKWEIERETDGKLRDQRVYILESMMHTTEVAIRSYRNGESAGSTEKPVVEKAEETEENNG